MPPINSKWLKLYFSFSTWKEENFIKNSCLPLVEEESDLLTWEITDNPIIVVESGYDEI